MKQLMSQNKDAYQLTSRAKQTWLLENEFNLLQIKVDLDSEKQS